MPTPVATAKQCLTAEAANALDEAVCVARARSHAQTTSLHAVSAFLSLPCSPLREACFQARNAAFCFYSSSPRAQIRALDFALSVALERSPTVSNHRVSEPPVSNSLMAAIKRSQANQRRQPDGFGFGKEQMGTSGIKVEIRNLIVAILDDPIVSRVFSEAGFSSFDLKLAMVRPMQGFWRSNSQRQRVRMSQELRSFKFPFSGEAFGDDNFGRIVEVLVRKQGRNPLLFGVCGYDALQEFVQTVRTQEFVHSLPLEIRGVGVVSVEREILKFASESFGAELMRSRFEELAAMVQNCYDPGLIVCFGDLKFFVMEEFDLRADLLSSLVAKFTSFLELYKDRVWLIGCATYEVYLKFLNKFPSVEKDWNLQPLAVTSIKSPKGDVSFKSSLMRSFVPFAGLFPPSSNFSCVSKSSYTPPFSSKLCSENPAHDSAGGSGYDSIADQCETALPSWLPVDKISPSNRSITSKIPRVEAKTNTEEQKLQIVKENSQLGPSKTESDPPANNCQTLSTSSVATDLVLGTSSHSLPGFKSLFEALITRVDGQEEAIRIISQTICHSRNRAKGSRERGDVWMNFTGSNTVAMKKTAIALAEVISGGKDSLIHVDLTSQDGLVDQCTVFGRRIISYSDEQIREITTIDQIALSLSKMPSSIVFLENLHSAHPPAQRSLLNAIRSGKFMDSHGREVCIGNAVFLLSSTLESVTSEPWSRESRCEHKLKPWPMQIVVNASSNLLNKRKLNSMDTPPKRLNKGSVARLDLNLPADENNEFQFNTWLEELLSQVGETVVFKPFDHYDARSKKTSTLIQGCFSKSFCSVCTLEIDPRAIDQLIAAMETEVEDWSENVLSVWFVEARKRYHNLVSHSVVNLDIVKPLYSREDEEEEDAFKWLPSEISLHCRPLESL